MNIYNNGLSEVDNGLPTIDNMGINDMRISPSFYLKQEEVRAKYEELYKMVGYISLELKSKEDISLDAKVIDAVIRHYKEYQNWAGDNK